MSERLKVTMAGGTAEYLDVATTDAPALERLIVDGKVQTEWLPIEGGKGVVRVGAIVGMNVEGKRDLPKEPDKDRLDRVDDERRLAGKPPTDDRSLERRIH